MVTVTVEKSPYLGFCIFSSEELRYIDRCFEIFARNFYKGIMPFPSVEKEKFLENAPKLLDKILRLIEIELNKEIEEVFNKFTDYVKINNKYFSYLYLFILITKLIYLDQEKEKWLNKIIELLNKEKENKKSWINHVKDSWINDDIFEKLRTLEKTEIHSRVDLSVKVKNIRNHTVEIKKRFVNKVCEILTLCFADITMEDVLNLLNTEKSTVSYIFFVALSINLRFLINFLNSDEFFNLDKYDRMIILAALTNYCVLLPLVIKFLFFLAFVTKFPYLFSENYNKVNPKKTENLKKFLLNLNLNIKNKKAQKYLVSLFGFFVINKDEEILADLYKNTFSKEICRPFKLLKQEYLERLFNTLFEINYILAFKAIFSSWINLKSKKVELETQIIEKILRCYVENLDELYNLLADLEEGIINSGRKLKNISLTIKKEKNDVFIIFKFKGTRNMQIKIKIQKLENNKFKLEPPNTAATETTTNAAKVAPANDVVGHAKDFTRVNRRRERVKDTRARNVVKVHSHF